MDNNPLVDGRREMKRFVVVKKEEQVEEVLGKKSGDWKDPYAEGEDRFTMERLEETLERLEAEKRGLPMAVRVSNFVTAELVMEGLGFGGGDAEMMQRGLSRSWRRGLPCVGISSRSHDLRPSVRMKSMKTGHRWMHR